MKIARLFCCTACPALLVACASTPESYPSLAIRDVERVSGSMEAATPEPYIPPPPPPAALDQAGKLAADAEAAHRQFTAEAAGGGSLAAADEAAEGSESWARAQVALASLQIARSRTMVPLADLDRLYVDAANEGQDLDRITAMRDQVAALVAEEDARIAELRGGRDR